MQSNKKNLCTELLTKNSNSAMDRTSMIIPGCSSFERSSCPERLMFYEDGSWIDYPKGIANLMKLGFVEGKPVVRAQFQGFSCKFDFCRMLETEFESGNQRSIAWIDADGKCFFPKVFVNSCDNDDECEGESRNSDGMGQKIRIGFKIRGELGSCEGLELDAEVKLSDGSEEGVGKDQLEGYSRNVNVDCEKIGFGLDERVELSKRNGEEYAELNSEGKVGDKIGEDVEREKTEGHSCNDNADGERFGLGWNKRVDLSKRKREENVEAGEMEVNSTNINAKKRQNVGSERRLARWLKARILSGEEKGYAIVKNLFLSAMEVNDPGAQVTAIHQYVPIGCLDKARCQVFDRQIDIMKQLRGISNVVFAWYGASAKTVESILNHGFGVPSKLPNSEGHGIGIHLSPVRSPHNSAMLSEIDENGDKHVILCRVILGNCEKVEAGSQQLYPSSVNYDSGVDDLTNPKWYTVWHSNMNTHILPVCVVSYRPVNVPGSVNGVPTRNRVPDQAMLVAELLSRLRSYLPLPKFQDLQSLHGLYKAGKLRKDIFVKQIRVIVGDDVLRSTIQEIRG